MIHCLELKWNVWQVWIWGVLVAQIESSTWTVMSRTSSAPWCLTHVKPLIRSTVQRCCYSTRNCASSPFLDLFSGNFCLTKDTRVAPCLHHHTIGFLSFWVNSGVHKWARRGCHIDLVRVCEILLREVMWVSKESTCEIMFFCLFKQHGGKWKVKVTTA